MESTVRTLKCGSVEIAVADRGAELRSYKVDGEEFMWDRNPEIWAASSPVLFPFVGSIKNGVYHYKGKDYEITTRHGFARTEDFDFSIFLLYQIYFSILLSQFQIYFLFNFYFRKNNVHDFF